jgi:hypothetical protein
VKSNEPPAEQRKGNRPMDSEVFADLVEKAMKRAVKQAIAEHHRAGNPVAIWRDGQVVLLYPDGSIQPVDGAGCET